MTNKIIWFPVEDKTWPPLVEPLLLYTVNKILGPGISIDFMTQCGPDNPNPKLRNPLDFYWGGHDFEEVTHWAKLPDGPV